MGIYFIRPKNWFEFSLDVFIRACNQTSLNKPISCCSGAIRRETPRSCWSDFTKRALRFALNLEVLLPSLGRRLSSISEWTQRELAKSLRFTAIFLAMDCRIIAHLSFVSTATSNQPMQPTALWRCAFMSILISVISVGAQPRSRSGG